jgi:predicted acetyltransferase
VAIEIRTITTEQQRAAYEIMAIVFGDTMTDQLHDDEALVAELDRYFAAFDGPLIAGTAAAYSFEVTVPGGARLPMAGVTNVGVVPTHRRQGLLRQMMAVLMDQAVERGEPIAGLTASESSIYRRFGYGISTRMRRIEIESASGQFLVPPRSGGVVRMATEDEGAKVMPAIWDQVGAVRPGWVTRTELWWELHARDRETWRDGATARRILIHEGAEGPDGYAVYRMKNEWKDGLPRMQARIVEVVAVSPEVEAALWRFLLDLDLVVEVNANAVAVDLPIVHRLVDPRRLQVRRERDHLWMRMLDIAACLRARAYDDSGTVVLEVHDGSRPDVGGRFRLDATPDGASCERTTESADLTLDVADISAAYLGGTRVDHLAAAGLVDEHTPGAVAKAGRLLAWPVAPWCLQDF